MTDENEIKKDTVDYRDPTPFDDTKLNSISEISKGIRHKNYGKDVREALAQQGEALVKLMQETGGNQSAEVAAARGNFELLGIRENAQDTAITGLNRDKADKDYVNNYLSKITYIPETVGSLAELESKYPNGLSGLFITADTGHKYIWDGSTWRDSGSYQAEGIANGSINPQKIDYLNATDIAISEITSINPNPWNYNDGDKKLSISFDGKTGYFKATSSITDQKDSGILFRVIRKSGDYSLYIKGVTSTLSQVTFYITDTAGTLKWKIGHYFPGGSSNENAISDIKSTVLDSCGIAIGEEFQILLSVSKSDVGGKSVYGNIQLLRDQDSLLQGNVNLKDLISSGFKNNQLYDLYQRGYLIDTKQTRWFSNSRYEVDGDGILTYWWDGEGNPGPYYKLSQPVASGQTIYVYFEARKISGENSSINIQFLNDNIFDEVPSNHRLADVITVRLSNSWESYFVPVELNRKWSNSDPSTAGVTLSVKPGVAGEINKIQLRNQAFIHERSVSDGLDVVMMDAVSLNQAIVPELAAGRRKGEVLPMTVIKNDMPKIHYVTPKSAVATDNVYLDSLTVNLENPEKVNFAVGAVDQNNLMIKSKEFSLDLPAGSRTISFKEDIKIPAGYRLFMDCHNQGVLYSSSEATEKILIEDEDHSISVNGYSGYKLYESPLMAPFSYRVRSSRLADTIAKIKTDTVANSQKVDNLQKSSGILTSPQGKRYSLIVNDDGSLTTVSLQSHKAFIFGNSLTVGLDDYGMAASDAEHGWAYLVAQKFKATDPDFSYRTLNGGENWESKTSSQDRLNALNTVVKPQLAADTDLVIIQLTDNVNTNAKRATFAQDAKDLITWFRQQAPKARIVWIASWFALDLIPDVRAACAERGALFCDISEYARPQQYKSALGNVWTDSQGVKHTIDNPGVAAHPGDLGMQMIAQSVEQTLGLI